MARARAILVWVAAALALIVGLAAPAAAVYAYDGDAALVLREASARPGSLADLGVPGPDERGGGPKPRDRR